MLVRRIILLLLANLLVILIASLAFSQIVYYVGNDIYILSESEVQVKAWIKPKNIDWEKFKAEIYFPNQDTFIQSLINRIILMFEIRGVLYIVNYGIDDSEKIVFATVMFNVEFSTYYNSEYKVIRFKDVLKEAGRGWFDEIHVRSNVKVYSWSPRPTRWSDYSASWFNPSMEAAPLWYEIALAPRYLVKVRVEGLPSSYTVEVRIDGRVVGTQQGGEEKVYTVIKSPVTVEVSAMVTAGRTRYVAERSTQTAEADSLAVFKYYAEHLIELDASPREGGLEVNGVRFGLPYSNWWREGTVLNVVAPSSIPIETTATTRKAYVFSRWSDNVASPSRSITVNQPLSLVAMYNLSVEYYVRLGANYGEVAGLLRGSGWYKEGGRATISAEQVVYVSDEIRLVFVEWSGLGSRTSYEIIVDSPKEFTAIYKRQFSVKVYAPYGTILDGWYDEGTTVSIRLPGLRDSYWYESDKVRRKFAGWRVEKGSVPFTWEPEFSFTISSPVVLYAEFSAREYLVVIDTDAEFVTEGYVLGPSPDITVIPLLVVDRFIGYEDLETGRLLGTSLLVNRPLLLARRYQRDYTGLIALTLVMVVMIGGVALVLYGRSLYKAGYSAGFKGLLARSYAKLAALHAGAATRVLTEGEQIVMEHEKELEEQIKELESRVKAYEEYLMKLEQMHERGEVADEIYRELKATYSEELEKYKAELNSLKEKLKKIEYDKYTQVKNP